MQHFRIESLFVVVFLMTAGTFAGPAQPDTAKPLPDSLVVDSSSRADKMAYAADSMRQESVPPTDSSLTAATVPKADAAAAMAQQPHPESETSDTARQVSDTIPHIAVANFFGRGIDSSTAMGLSDRCRLLLSNYSALPVMGLREMEDSLLAHERGSGRVCDHNDCLIETGRMLGVRYVVGGSAGSIGGLLTLAIRLIDVGTGKVLLFRLVDTRQEIGDVLTLLLPEITVEINNKIRNTHAATVAIQSEPPGAAVEFDRTPIGKTPLLLKNVKVGMHDIRLSLERHREVIDTFALEKFEGNGKRYVLELTDKAATAYREKKRVQWAIRGIGLFGAVAALSAGVHYDSRLDQVEAVQQGIVNEYNSAGTSGDDSFFSERYRYQSKLYDRYVAWRNFSFVAAAAMAAGVGVTLLF